MWIKLAVFALSAALLSASAASAPDTLSSNPDLLLIPQQEISYRTAEVVAGELERKASFGALIMNPVYEVLRAPVDGIVTQAYVSGGNDIKKGTVIAEFSVEDNAVTLAALELDYDVAADKLERELAALNETLTKEMKALAEARTSLLTENALRIQELRVERARENRDYAKYNGERSLAKKREDIEELREDSTDFSIISPIDGTTGSMPYLPVGGKVSAGDIIAVVYDPVRFYLSVTEGNIEMLKCGAEVMVTVKGRDIPKVKGHVISNTTLLDSKASVNKQALIAIDDPESLINSMTSQGLSPGRQSYLIEINLSASGSALLVPRGAVKQEGSRKYVSILEDGMKKKRYVLTGLSDTSRTQIISGLEEGMTIILN